jgi:hypothetical protein
MEQAGIAVTRWVSLQTSICSSCQRTQPNCNPVSGSGRLATNPWRSGPLPRSTN